MSESLQPKPIEVDADGLLKYPDLHDAELTGITQRKELDRKLVTLDFELYSGAKFKILLRDVVLIKCSDFTLQNVVFDVHYISGSSPSQWTEELRSEFPSNAEVAFKKLLEDVQQGRRGLFHITPSVGCAVICLCGSMEVFASS
jgi:hypothetical protein